MNIVLDKFYYDALNEVGNIGMGNATTALSQLVGKSVSVSGSAFTLLGLNDISTEHEYNRIGAIVKVVGDLNGGFLLMLNQKHSDSLSEMLLEQNEHEDDGYMRRSVVVEVANILAGSYYNALSKFLDLSVIPSIPIISEGSPDDLLKKCSQHFNGKIEHVMGLTTLFEIQSEDQYQSLSGDMYMLMDSGSMKTILNRIDTMRT
ncbi:chemotaxis protein CheC [Methanolobus zinderi]|jgi:chemotaxis protein CheC|uniref:Chemotaxis protein CheC n=1 Tax=Methanolobus zinderi TaxID=536044 RepID=A0A7D5IQH4_9EURY|nr:chemotaxis protein CheC [Methanolobus zinderi]KXS42605.1 MAG: inhibitor of MCP methylation CheC [Methanolobus sp. T82-4]QLC50527.1 chemotaxis protein CheC [Methanolobus zinderi]